MTFAVVPCRTQEEVAMSERLSKRAKLLYGVGDTGLSLTGSIIGAFFAIFLTDVAGIRPGMAAAAIFIGRTWDYVNDPLIGHLSDRARTRWGRRRPFLLFGSIPFALAFAMLWWRPPLDNQIALTVYYALAYIVYEVAATFIYMPYFALTPELTLDYDERTSLTSYRMFFSIAGSLVAFTIPLAMVGRFTGENAPRILLMGLVFGLVSAAGMLTTFFGTRERQEYQEQKQPRLLDSLRAALKNRPFIFSMAVYLLTWMAVKVVESTLLFFVKYVIERESHSDLIMAVIFVVAIFALPLWEWASRHLNKRLAYVAGIAFWAVVQIVLVTLGASTPLVVILFLAGLAGIGVSAAHVIPWAIIPDAIEWDELQTGERHEGIFYSLVILIQKIAISIALPLTLLLLDATGYVANAARQVDSAVMGIRILTGPIPAVLLCSGIVFALLYPMTREKHAEVRQEIQKRRIAETEQTA
jgi:GPH family glycoside/pentoside/hexuronide:cation symporter